MALERKDRVQDTTTTTGTGTLSLGASADTGYRTFVSALTDGATVRYLIQTDDKSEWEIGEGIFTDATPDTLTRVTIYASSNAGAKVNFSAGTKKVYCNLTAQDIDDLNNGGWDKHTNIIPTRASSDDPTFELTFAGVDLTDKLSEGMKIKWTQNSTTRYGFITAISFSTDTTLTLYGGTDYDVDDTTTHAITDVYFSHMKAPYGFPLDPDKWTVETVSTAIVVRSNPDTSWANTGSFQIEIPIGIWRVSYEAPVQVIDKNSRDYVRASFSLSTSASSEGNGEFVTAIQNRATYSATYGLIIETTVSVSNILSLSTKNTYYFINTSAYAMTDGSISIATVSGGELKIRAVCAYL